MSITIGTGSWFGRRGEAMAEAVIEASWLAAVLLVPSFFNPFSGRSFEPDRAVLLLLLVTIGVAAWVGKVVAGGRAAAPLPEGTGGGAWRALRWAVPAVAAAVAVSTALSPEPRTSWWGSFARGYGTVTQLALLAFLGLVLAHLRRPEQQRRMLFAVVLGSLPVCLYGLLQAAGRDPIAWDRGGWRVHSSLGNPIFLGAYLVVVVFMTLAWLAPTAGRIPGRPGRLAAAAGIYVLVVQLAAGLLTQSRGPLLGLAGGAVLLGVISVLAFPAATPGRRAALAVAVLLLAVGSVAMAAALARAGGDSRWMGRLGRLSDPAASSTRVRLLIWDGVARTMVGHDGPEAIAGPGDPYEALRPAVGYGPEMVLPATASFMPAELGELESGRGADRAHNEVWELAVTVGSVGVAAWLLLWLAGFELALAGLGLVPGGSRVWHFRGIVAGATVAGGLAPGLATGSWALSGLGAGAGLLAGVAAGAVVGGLSGRRRLTVTGSGVLLACLIAALAAHLAEVQVGIAVVSSRLLAFAALGLVPSAVRGPMTPSVDAPDRSPVSPALAGIASAGIGAVLVFGLARAPAGCTGFVDVVRANLAVGQQAPLPAMLGLIFVTAGLLASGWGGPRNGRRVAAALVAAAGAVGAYLVVHGARLAAGVSPGSRPTDPWAVVDLVAGRLNLLLAVAGLATIAMAAVLAHRTGSASRPLPRSWGVVAALPAAFLLVGFVVRPLLIDVRADTGFRHAAVLAAAGRSDDALAVAAEARQLAPGRGWAAVAEARLATAVAAGAASRATAQEAAARCREAAADARSLIPWTVAASPVLPPCPGAAADDDPTAVAP